MGDTHSAGIGRVDSSDLSLRGGNKFAFLFAFLFMPFRCVGKKRIPAIKK